MKGWGEIIEIIGVYKTKSKRKCTWVLYTLINKFVSLVLLVNDSHTTIYVMQETWVWSLDWEDPLEKGKATHSGILAWRNPWMQRIHGDANSGTRLSDFTFTFHFHALKKEMATHFSVLAWRIPGMGEPGGLPSTGSHRVGHDWSNLAAAADD